MTQKNIAIIGAAPREFVDYASENNVNYTIFLDTRRPQIAPFTISADFSDNSALIRAVEEATYGPYTAVITFYEEYVVTTAILAKGLGLHGLSPEAAVACTDKTVMRGSFLSSPLQISPAFTIIESFDDALAFTKTYGFPVMLKPASLAKSLLVTKIDNEASLREQYFKLTELLPHVYAKYAPRNEPKLLIEEFMEGSIHSIDAFAAADGTPTLLEHIVDYQTGYDIGYDDNFHYSRLLPTTLSAADQKALKDCAAAGMKALRMKYSPAHIEIIMTKKGPRIVEIGARNGGYRQKIHRSAHGIDLYNNHIALLHDEPIHLKPLRNDPCAVLELFPKQHGLFDGIHNQEALQELSSLKYLNIRANIGEVVGKSGDGYKAVAVVMLHNNNVKAFNHDLAWFHENVFIKTVAQ